MARRGKCAKLFSDNEKLPESIKNILVVSDENLSKLAVMADKISDMTPRTKIFATGKSLDCGENNVVKRPASSQQNSKP
ncbi:hypothetical protein TNCV_4685771 [Trichonephila clavipes]|nr:hypothetical protein TNCV_4685771 [Trichonephila clavipes]